MTVAQEIEYEKAQERKLAFAEGLSEGEKLGVEKGRASVCIDFVRQGIITVSQAAEQLGISEDDVRKMTETSR